MLHFTFTLVAISLGVRFFVDLQTQFHPPTRKIKAGLDVLTVVCLLGCLCCACVEPVASIASGPVSAAYGALTAAWGLALLFSSTAYLVSILRFAARSAQKDFGAQQTGLVQLVRVVRGVNIGGLVGFALTISQQAIVSVQPSYVIGFDLAFGLLEMLYLGTLVFLMGRPKGRASASVSPKTVGPARPQRYLTQKLSVRSPSQRAALPTLTATVNVPRLTDIRSRPIV